LLVPCLGLHQLSLDAHEKLVNVRERVDDELGRVLQIMNHHVGEDFGALVLSVESLDLLLLLVDDASVVLFLHQIDLEAFSLHQKLLVFLVYEVIVVLGCRGLGQVSEVHKATHRLGPRKSVLVIELRS